MYTVRQLTDEFNRFLSEIKFHQKPESLYEPIRYILSLGGKRVRPVLLLGAYNLYEKDLDFAMNAAFAVELFHNFTLVHDDIMDQAELRRGLPTVHQIFGVNSALLAGDVMMMYVYKFFSFYKKKLYRQMVVHFTSTAINICEGQQMDMDFESRSNVTIPEYFEMIGKKTAILFAESLYLGGLLAGCRKKDLHHLFEFGRNLGIAFQLQDDLLDVYGEMKKVGKQQAGDILQRKKTYLYLKTVELLDPDQSSHLKQTLSSTSENDGDRITRVLEFYKDVNVKGYAEQVIEAYTQLAVSHLESIRVDTAKKQVLRNFTSLLEARNQ